MLDPVVDMSEKEFKEHLERKYLVAELIEKLLSDARIWSSCEPCDFGVRVSIEGDWKHDHLRAKLLMEEAGYDYCGEVPTEDTGEDYYPADHYIRVS